MAKKITNVYLNNDEDYGKILIEKHDGQEQRQEKPQKPKKEKIKREKKNHPVWNVFRPIVMCVAALVIVCGIVYYGYGKVKERYFTPVDVNDSAKIEVTIPKSSSLSTISQILYDNDIVKNPTVFKLYADFSDKSYKLKAGTYELSRDMTYDDIIYTLMKGEPPQEAVDVTLTEGMSIEAMAAQLVESGVLTDDKEFLEMCRTGEAFSNISYIKDVIDKADGRNYVLEGYMFPDTYNFYVGSDAATVADKMITRFEDIMTDEYMARAEEVGMSVDEVMTLASIIEKEAKQKDFKKVSAVFHNRLAIDMPLQSCATMQVVTGEKKYTFTDDELAVDSPYNTYMYKGLPVGPICNPGQSAIEAALYPDEQYVEEEYLYFCLTTPESGDQVFARTLDEHNANVAQWREYWG